MSEAWMNDTDISISDLQKNLNDVKYLIEQEREVSQKIIADLEAALNNNEKNQFIQFQDISRQAQRLESKLAKCIEQRDMWIDKYTDDDRYEYDSDDILLLKSVDNKELDEIKDEK